MVECILFYPERRYTQYHLSDLLPVLEEQPGDNKKGTEKGLSIFTHECEFIKYCRDNAATLSEHDWYAMITELSVFEGGVELIHEYSKPYKDYDPVETQKKMCIRDSIKSEQPYNGKYVPVWICLSFAEKV